MGQAASKVAAHGVKGFSVQVKGVSQSSRFVMRFAWWIAGSELERERDSPHFSPAIYCSTGSGSACCVTLGRTSRRIAVNTTAVSLVASLAFATTSITSLREPVRNAG